MRPYVVLAANSYTAPGYSLADPASTEAKIWQACL